MSGDQWFKYNGCGAERGHSCPHPRISGGLKTAAPNFQALRAFFDTGEMPVLQARLRRSWLFSSGPQFPVEKREPVCVFSRPVKSACRVLITLALVLSIGLHWAVLQSAAWVGMIVSYSHEGSITLALEKTFDGEHPCALCHLVQEGSQQDQQDGPAKQTLVKKLDLAVEILVAFVPRAVPPIAEWEPEQFHASVRTTDPATPPPRALAA